MALRLPQRADLWLFDCGEATQHQFLRSELRVSQLRRIFITHMHGDHVFGLPGLLASLGMAGTCTGVDLYGPAPLEPFITAALQHSATRIGYPLRFHPVELAAADGTPLLVDGELSVTCTPLKHRVPAYGYRVQQSERPGRFDIAKAKAMGLPPGPEFARLKAGETVTFADGRRVDGRELCGASQPGLSLVYCTDTVFSENAVKLSRGADLLIHEATFSHRDAAMAYQKQHSTSTMAAQTAAEAGVKQLALTHLSPRYVPGAAESPDDLLQEARAIFRNTVLAKDFLSLEVGAAACNSL